MKSHYTAPRSGGFTLIELIIVIVLLGILAAVALPRFLSAAVDARTSSIKGMAAAITTAKNLAKDRYRMDLATGAGSVTLDGQAVTVLSGGNPTGNAAGIEAALESCDGSGVCSGFSVAHASSVSTFTVTGYAGANCKVVYTPANSPPTDIVTTTSGC